MEIYRLRTTVPRSEYLQCTKVRAFIIQWNSYKKGISSLIVKASAHLSVNPSHIRMNDKRENINITEEQSGRGHPAKSAKLTSAVRKQSGTSA